MTQLQALGIRDGRFVGADKELDLIVEIFSLNVKFFDSYYALSADMESGELRFSESVSTALPQEDGVSKERMDIILLRENIFEYSLLYDRYCDEASEASSPDAVPSLIKAPKFTTLHSGEFDLADSASVKMRRPRVPHIPLPPTIPRNHTGVYFDLFSSPPQELIMTFELPNVESRDEVDLRTTKHSLELTVSDSSCGIEFTF